jgi:hypothetical protein
MNALAHDQNKEELKGTEEIPEDKLVIPPWDFRVGDRVMYRVSTGWGTGRIINLSEDKVMIVTEKEKHIMRKKKSVKLIIS